MININISFDFDNLDQADQELVKKLLQLEVNNALNEYMGQSREMVVEEEFGLTLKNFNVADLDIKPKFVVSCQQANGLHIGDTY